MTKRMRYLVAEDYMANPSVHVFGGRLYIYPSHDWESGIDENDNGDHFNMQDYHVFSADDVMFGEIKDHGVVLRVEDIPLAGRHLCYAVGDNPYGPFIFQGVILTPVVGWTPHHSIVEYHGKWYLFHHDCVPPKGKTWLRSLKICELEYDAERHIVPILAETLRENSWTEIIK